MGLTKGPFYNLFMKVFIKLTILFSLFLFPEQLFAQDVEGYLHAVGGKENLKSTINIRLSYTVEYYPSKHEQPKSYAIIKIVNASNIAINKIIEIKGASKLATKANVTVLKSNSILDVNNFSNPATVSPVNSVISVNGNKLNIVLAANSFTVYRVGI